MPKCPLYLLTASTLALVAGAARAERGPQFGFNAGAATDYVFRGVDQTDRHGQVFAGADMNWGEGYAGAFTSNVDFSRLGDPRVNQEVDLYGGWRPEFKGYQFDFGAIYYGYLNQARGAHDDYAEASARVSRDIGPVSAALSLHWSPQFQGHTGNAWYGEATASYAFTRALSASALLGRQTIERGRDYTVWNAGGTWSFAPHLGLDLRWWDTDAHSLGQPWRGKLVASLKATF